jgi:hypothetical protein
MGEAGARRARDEFCWPRQAERIASLYRVLCAQPQARRGATETSCMSGP